MAAVATLAACAPTPQPRPTEAPAPAIDPSPSVSAEAGASFWIERLQGCGEVSGLEPVSASEPEQINGFAIPTLRDSGPRVSATGRAIIDEAGVPVAYEVADGDVLDVVTARFCAPHSRYLTWINSVRMEPLEGSDSIPLWPGDIVNLDAHTIASVGSQQGRVADRDPGFAIPPQQ